MEIKITELLPDETTWLRDERLLADKTVTAVNFGATQYEGRRYLCFAHEKKDGKVLSYKLRLSPREKQPEKDKKWRFNPSKTLDVFGRDYWPEENPTLVWLTEGELDCLLLTQEGQCALTRTTGVSSSVEACLEFLPLNCSVALAFDNDESGIPATSKATTLIQQKRPDVTVKYVKWPEKFNKDVTDYALLCKKEDEPFVKQLSSLLVEAEKKEVGLSVQLSDNDKSEKTSRTQTPSGSSASQEMPTATLEDVLERTRKLGMVHDYLVEVVLATCISKEIEKRNPVWLMVVGNPSSNKTQMIWLLRGAPETIHIDTLTTNPFISGAPQSQDLLPHLDGKCYCVKDYTPFFGRSEETVKQLLSDMVAIYDGEFSKHSPTRGTISYKATFSHIGGVTPQGLLRRQRYMTMVGARFLYIRIPQLSNDERNSCLSIAWTDDKDMHSLFSDASKYAISLVHSISATVRSNGLKLEPEELPIRSQLNCLANLMARGRGVVLSNSAKFENDEGVTVSYTELEDVQVEEPFRALHQLKALCRSLAVLRGKETVTQEEVNVAKIITFSSMPVHRAETFQLFHHYDELTAKEAAEHIENRSQKTVRRHLDELFFVGILQREKHGMSENATWVFSVKPEFKSLLDKDNNHESDKSNLANI